MPVIEVLSAERVSVSCEAEGLVRVKADALRRLAVLLAKGQGCVDADRILQVLTEREQLQSTGVGGGVAVPHGSVDELDRQVGALLLCPEGIPFEAIDGEPVAILFALIGPKGRPAQHLKILARISRLLKEATFRSRLLEATGGRAAYEMICDTDRGAA